MANNNGFPDGWMLTKDGGSAVAVTLVAAGEPNVVRVLDSFSVKVENLSGASADFVLVLFSSDNVYNNYVLSRLAVAAPAESTDSDSASGLGLSAGPGASLTIKMNAGVANIYQFLRVQGHDV